MSFKRVKMWLERLPTFCVIPALAKNNIFGILLIEFFHNFFWIERHIIVDENVVLRFRAEAFKILVGRFCFENQVVVRVHEIADDKVIFVFKRSF